MYDYYQISTKETIQKLGARLEGLTQKEVKKRLGRHGLNQLEEKETISPVKIFFNQFKDPIIAILLAAIIISVLVHEILDALVIAAILLLNAILGFSQEYKAEKSIQLLKKMSSPKAKVIREGREQIIDAKYLVPGDIIILEAGDKAPADARILDMVELHVDESMLTGESVPVTKSINQTKEELPIAERKNMFFSGTILTNGRAKAVVTETGMETQLGKIAEMVQTVEEVQTPLQKRLAKLGKKLGIITVVVCAIVLLVGFLKGMPFVNILLITISLAVSAIPEGLPVVVTIALAIGVQRMLKKRALIRNLKSVETLGAVTTICSDKTGTITKNEMTVTEIFANNQTITVTGGGYDTKGEFFIGNKKITPERIKTLLRTAASCNNATLSFGDPTEIALVVVAKKAGIEKEERIGEIPFDSVKKYMITKHKENLWHIKGATGKVLSLCTHIQTNNTIKKLTANDKENIKQKNREMASKALRVLSMAYKKDNKTIFTGLVGMIDPPREEVKGAVNLCKQAGIRIVMITGDNVITAEAVANKVGITGKVMEGIHLNKITDQDLRRVVKEVTIFARVNPEHKVKILKALQANGEIVAMTGDGVNDAPALKGADVGVSMEVKGTDVAREASDMILTDDNFASIVSAVKEGRVIYDNIKKFVKFLLSVNFSEVGLILFSILVGIPLPLLPLQILWINLVTDSLPALALGVDTPEPKVMERKPRNPKDSILKGSTWFLIIAGCLTFLTTLAAFFIGMSFDLANGVDLSDFSNPSKARTMALTTSILFQMLFVFSCRTDKQSVFKIGIFSNKWLVGAVGISIMLQIIAIYTPLSLVFKLVPLGIIDWAIIVGLASLGFVVFEIKKLITYKEK